MLSDQDEFFAMKKPSIDDTLDEQTIRQILADKRRELELPVRWPKGLLEVDSSMKETDAPFMLQTLLWKACGEEWFWFSIGEFSEMLYDVLERRQNDPIRKCISKLEYILRSRNNKELGIKEVDLNAKKAEVPIREFIGTYITLPHRSRPGSLFPCPLPTHQDKTSSFMIYDKNNRWKCFWCGKGGTHIDFIMHMENCSLSEAVKKFINY